MVTNQPGYGLPDQPTLSSGPNDYWGMQDRVPVGACKNIIGSLEDLRKQRIEHAGLGPNGLSKKLADLREVEALLDSGHHLRWHEFYAKMEGIFKVWELECRTTAEVEWLLHIHTRFFKQHADSVERMALAELNKVDPNPRSQSQIFVLPASNMAGGPQAQDLPRTGKENRVIPKNQGKEKRKTQMARARKTYSPLDTKLEERGGHFRRWQDIESSYSHDLIPDTVVIDAWYASGDEGYSQMLRSMGWPEIRISDHERKLKNQEQQHKQELSNARWLNQIATGEPVDSTYLPTSRPGSAHREYENWLAAMEKEEEDVIRCGEFEALIGEYGALDPAVAGCFGDYLD